MTVHSILWVNPWVAKYVWRGSVVALTVIVVMMVVGCWKSVKKAPSARQQEVASQAPARLAESTDLESSADPVDDAIDQTIDHDSLYRRLEKLINASPLLPDEDNELQADLREAEDTLSRIKRENAQAMRHANRQVRIRGTNSPNIILVVSSALACSDLSCYEPACFDTPHIDNLASQGVRFTNYYAGSSEDRGSLWSLIMGLSTCRLPTGTPITLQPGSQNLAEVLWQAGYATGIIGDCSLGGILIGSAEQYGFDEWFRPGDPDRAAEPYPAYAWNNGARIRVLANANGQQGKHAADLIADETAAFLDRHSRGRPFFLLVCYPPPIADAPLRPRDAARDLAADWQIAAHQADAPGVARWDEDIGAVVERLQRLAIQHHSIIFFTSRHARRDQAPADLHERHIRVPLIVAAPGRIAGGRTSDQVCAAWDLLPTIADMVGALRRPRASDGLSIVAAIRNQTQQTHEVLAWQLAAPQGSQAIRMGTWKAIRPAGSAALQLFDLRADSAETTDVAAQHPDIVQQLESQFSSINSDQYRLPGNASPSHDDI